MPFRLLHPSLILALAVVAIGLGVTGGAAAEAQFDVTGKYERVEPPQPTETGDKVEVLDVFWYGCPHCFHFLPYMERWEEHKPDYVVVRRMPAVFRESWKVHAKAYYTAKLLGIADKIHRPLFDEIHVKGRRMDNEKELAEFFGRFGVSEQEFLDTFNSFAVASSVQRATVMQDRYGIMGTPTVIVNGKYRVSGDLAGSYEAMVKVIGVLAEREHQTMMSK